MTLAPAPVDLLRRLTRGADDDRVTHIERFAARPGRQALWPAWTPAVVRDAFRARGIEAPWQHQASAASLAFAGTNVVVATGTASGKSLAYQLPALASLVGDERATALYLSPTKALAADQLRTLQALDVPGVRPAVYDGDTARDERAWAREHSRFILTNPDMLHRGILPAHQSWGRFLRGLRYVVIDECHTYRGVFGSHVAHVLRRLRRVLARYRAHPVFVLASATTGDPAGSGSRLTGLPLEAVTEDHSPHGGMTFALWEPPLLPAASGALDSSSDSFGTSSGSVGTSSGSAGTSSGSVGTSSGFPGTSSGFPDGEPVRRSALSEAADVLADAVASGVRTLAFIRSRRGAELVATMARRSLDYAVPGLGSRVAAYRSGYLREERRAIERSLLEGDLLGLASTNALELGVDLVGLDAVVMAGYPGTVASMWQQAGRAGRAGRDAVCVLIARDDPLDTYLIHHPEALFGRPVEATVLDPGNRHVLGPQLCCAAAELPLTEADLPMFGPTARATLDELVAVGVLRKRPTGWYWTDPRRPDVDLRGGGGGPIAVVESATGRLLGTVDSASAHHQVHQGAVHLHQGTAYVVDELDLADGVALVHQEEPEWSTHPRDITSVTVTSVRSSVDAGPVALHLGEVDVTAQVVSYQRRRIATGEVIDTRHLDLPERRLSTVAVWWTVTDEALDAAGLARDQIPGALHAAEHASIGLLPLVATCDRWDIGGLSTNRHEDTDLPTVFVYDGHPGGAGFAERAFEVATHWLDATRSVIAECACDRGCPSCIQSPKCGNGNNPLGKTDAVTVLDIVLPALSRALRPAM